MPLSHHLLYHRRLYLGGAVGVAIGLLLPDYWGLSLRAIIGWDAAILVYLAMVVLMMASSSHHHIRQRAAVEDEGRWVLLAVTSGGALASLFAIGMLLAGTKDMAPTPRASHFGLGGLTILLSWLFIHVLYAIHYAYGHYREAQSVPRADTLAGLVFPGTPDPDYWDFCYFSFTIGMTAQTSDVTVNSRTLRRLTLVHGIVSFCFNTVLLALTINIAAGML